MKKMLLGAIAALLMASCCGQSETITIVSTNDIHSAIDRFPALATLVDSLRAGGGQVLLIDAGDRRTGNPFVDKAPHAGRPIIELMNELRYDLATFGNHEFDQGVDTASVRIADSAFPYLLTNIVANGSIPEPLPYLIREVGGIKIAFVAMITTTVNGHPDGFDQSYGNAIFTEPIETIKRYAHLADSADMFVAVTHTGSDVDSLMALAVPQLSLIIGGHSHTIYPQGNRVGTTLITQTGSNLKYAGVTTIKVSCSKVEQVTTQLVDLKSIRPNQKYAAMVEQYNNAPQLQKVIGSTSVEFNKVALANFMSDAIRKASGSNVALYNIGGVRKEALAQGDMRVAEIYALEPFGNYPTVIEMSADQIKELILLKFNTQGKEGHGIDLLPSGMSYKVVTDGAGEGINVIFDFGTTKPSSSGKYRVAMSDYVARTYNFPQRGQMVIAGTKTIAELLVDDVAKNSPIKPNTNLRAEIIKRER